MARAAIFRVANNQHDSVFRSVRRVCGECQRGSKKDRGEEASVHKRDDSGARAECQHGAATMAAARRFSQSKDRLRGRGRPVFEPPTVVINPRLASDYWLGW